MRITNAHQETIMEVSFYDRNAPKKSTNLSINSDLLQETANLELSSTSLWVHGERERTMASIKARMVEVIQEQPEDATYEEIMRELAFERMVSRGLKDSRAERIISNDEMQRRIRSWQR